MTDFFKGTVTRRDWMAVGGILGATLVAIALFAFLVHARQQEQLTQLETELETKRQELQKAQITQRNFKKLQEETEKVSKLVATFERRLPDKRDMPRLLSEIEGLAAEVGVEVKLNTLDPAIDERKETIPYSVLATGDFHRITSFINKLERHERYLKVSELSISEQKDGVAEAKFTLSTYSFRQSAPAATVVTKGPNSPAAQGGTQQ